MELILMVGIPGSGKSTFVYQNFYKTHLRLNLDMLKSVNRQASLIDACLQSQTKFVIDNTSVTKERRSEYIKKAKSKNYKVICYFIPSSLDDSWIRNAKREGWERVPYKAVKSFHDKLESPSFDEGFDQIFVVNNMNNGTFSVTEMEKPLQILQLTSEPVADIVTE